MLERQTVSSTELERGPACERAVRKSAVCVCVSVGVCNTLRALNFYTHLSRQGLLASGTQDAAEGLEHAL